MIRKLFSAVLILGMALCLCACNHTDPAETQAVPNPVYTVTVTDQAGTPISGVVLYLKSSTNTYPGTTNDQGQAVFSIRENTYKVLLTQPEGYTGQTEYDFPPDSHQLTVIFNSNS